MGKDAFELRKKETPSGADSKTDSKTSMPDFSDSTALPPGGQAPAPLPAERGGAAKQAVSQNFDVPSPETVRSLERAAPSIVRVVTERGAGSGFFADDNGRIVTDAHVIMDAEEIFVITADGKRYRAGVDNIDDLEDTATLKLLGPDKSPFPAIKVGDAAKLKPDDPVYSLGHPLGVPEITVTPGRYLSPVTPFEFFAGVEPSFPGFLGWKYAGAGPETRHDLLTALWRPALLLTMDTLKGNSGGPYVNAQGEMVGIVQMGGFGLSVGAPADRVQRLFTTPGKFEIRHGFQAERWTHSYQQALASDPFKTISLTAATTVPGGAIGYYLARKVPRVAGVAFAAQGTFSLLDDVPSYFDATNSRDSWKYGVASGADALQTVGGIAMLFPRARTVGIVTAAIGLTGRIGADFIPNRYVVESVTRRDGSPRAPFNWNDLEK